jgi:CRP-like cAMP-binding protein
MILESHPDVDYHAYMLDALPHIPLFRDLEPAQIARLKSLFEPFACATETAVFEQGDRATHLYLILTGKVAIQYKPYDGPPIILTHLREGDVFGWSAVIGSERYTSTILSETPLESIRIRGADLWRLAEEHPQIGRLVIDRLAGMVSPRWTNAHEQIESLLMKVNMKEKNMNSTTTTDKEMQIRHLIENLSAYIEQFHGGTVEVVALEGDSLKVKLGGACLNCPLLPSTLHGWVEGTVHQFFPEIKVEEAK